MELHGKSVFGGIAMGRLSVYHKTDNAVKRTKITDIEAEKKRLTHSKRYWAFDDKKYSGKGEGSARHPENEKRKEELLADRRLWNPDKKKVTESKNSARQPEDFL